LSAGSRQMPCTPTTGSHPDRRGSLAPAVTAGGWHPDPDPGSECPGKSPTRWCRPGGHSRVHHPAQEIGRAKVDSQRNRRFCRVSDNSRHGDDEPGYGARPSAGEDHPAHVNPTDNPTAYPIFPVLSADQRLCWRDSSVSHIRAARKVAASPAVDAPCIRAQNRMLLGRLLHRHHHGCRATGEYRRDHISPPGSQPADSPNRRHGGSARHHADCSCRRHWCRQSRSVTRNQRPRPGNS